MKATVQLTDPDQPSPSPQMSPLLKRILSSPVLYAVSLPLARRKNGIWKRHTWLVLAIVSLAFLVCWLAYRCLPEHATDSAYPDVNSLSAQSDHLYGVVFDAGSTGSRVHVFELSRKVSSPSGTYILTDELFEHVQPGLSSYAEYPDKAAGSLSPLLDAALKRLPKGTCSRTPVVLRATAGLRLLSSSKADNILSAVRQMFSRSCLVKSSNSVSILDGNQEGLYLWISLNIMTNRMPSPIHSRDSINSDALGQTVGTLDLGGGSTQITFAPRKLQTLFESPEGFVTDVTNGTTVRSADAVLGKHVYSQSYLGLGLMSARYSMLHTMTKRMSARYRISSNLFSPCLPPAASVNWSHAGRNWVLKHLPLNNASTLLFPTEIDEAVASLQMTGSSSVFDTCYAQALQVLKDPVEGSHSENVYNPSGYVVHRPNEILTQEFYAFSYVFDLASSVGLINSLYGQQVTIAQFRDAADRVCSNPNESRPFECMDLSYITALLHDGYGFPWNQSITLQKKIDSYEISWGLGALFAELSALKMI